MSISEAQATEVIKALTLKHGADTVQIVRGGHVLSSMAGLLCRVTPGDKVLHEKVRLMVVEVRKAMMVYASEEQADAADKCSDELDQILALLAIEAQGES